MAMRARATTGAVAVSVSLLASAAQAETIAVEGYFPATSDAGIELEVIGIDPLDGGQGSKLGFALKRALEQVRVDGETWFDIPASRNAAVDAVIQGAADDQSSITEIEDKEVRSCVRKDEDKKCIRYKTTFYACSRYTVSLYPDIELVSREGEVLYSARDEMTRSRDHCTDESSRPSQRAMLDDLVDSFAGRVRRALAPRFHRADYRILERRKGLEKADRKAFKDAIKMTKSNEDAACEAFNALEPANPAQASVLYNIALCHERFGEYEAARATYERALAAEPDKPMTLEAFSRVDGWMRGREQLAMRAEIMAARYADAAANDQPMTEADE